MSPESLPFKVGRLRARLRRRLELSHRQLQIQALNRRLRIVGPQQIDPRTRFPSYLSFDRLIDRDLLRSLDGEVTAELRRVVEEGSGRLFNTGELKRGLLQPTRPGSRVIPLTESVNPEESFDYFELDDPEQWRPSPLADRFPGLMDFIRTLPFERTARIVILCDPLGRRVTTHRDHCHADVLHEFIWFRTNLDKPFFLQDAQTSKTCHVDSYSSWFDVVNQYHGVDPTGQLTFSVRVDGVFDASLRALFPPVPLNRASLPALWATFEPEPLPFVPGSAPMGGARQAAERLLSPAPSTRRE